MSTRTVVDGTDQSAAAPVAAAVQVGPAVRPRHDLDDVRWALAVGDDVPLITFDARTRISVRNALLSVLRTSRDRARAKATMGAL